MAPAIPDRWINYTPIGKRIDGTRFIAFKVPLHENINDDVDEKKRLDGRILLKAIPNLGMIIDLTNTTRYYNPDLFLKKGIEYSKLMIPGHHTPPPHLVKQFKNTVISFLNENSANDKLIGVHCTHGVNRTGYLICHFMITELGIQMDEAISNFSRARGHKIERQNYLDSLNSLKMAQKLDQSSRDVHNNMTMNNKESLSWRTRPEPIVKKLDKSSRDVYNNMPMYNKEPLVWRTRPEPPLRTRSRSRSRSPEIFDRRTRFDRFRQEANAQRRRYTHVAPPDSEPIRPAYMSGSSSHSSSNYNQRYVNTSSRNSRGGGHPYPYQFNNHHNQLTNTNNSYDDRDYMNHLPRNQMYERDYRTDRNYGASTSGERNYNRYKSNRRI